MYSLYFLGGKTEAVCKEKSQHKFWLKEFEISINYTRNFANKLNVYHTERYVKIIMLSEVGYLWVEIGVQNMGTDFNN